MIEFHAFLADPGTAMLMSIGATVIGSGIKAYGDWYGGQFQKAMYNYQAGVQRAMAGIADKMAQWDISAGAIKQQQADLVARAAIGREAVHFAAGNIGGRTPMDVRGSQEALALENRRIIGADAAHAAYGEEVKAAGYTAQAGVDVVAGQQAAYAGDISAIGSIVSGAGSVAGKWYDVSSLQGPTTAGINPDSPAGRTAYASSIYGESNYYNA